MKLSKYKDDNWCMVYFKLFLFNRERENDTELDIELATLDQLQDEFPDDWADFAVLEGV